MNNDDRGAIPTVVAAGVLVLIIGGIGAAGLAIADTDPTGDEILEATSDRYMTAESVVTDATVTVANDTTEQSVSLSAVTTADDQARITVTDDGQDVIAGTDGDRVWIYNPQEDITAIANETAENASDIEIRAGPDADLDVDPAAMAEGSLTQVNQSDYDGNSEQLEGVLDELDPELREELDTADSLGEVDFAGVFDTDNLTAQQVSTTTLDGEDAYVVSVTHPETDGETRLWISTETNELLQQRSTHPESDRTVTVDVSETRFNVSAADSTFQPPNADAGSDLSPTVTESIDELRSYVDFPVATPNDAWEFTQGTVATTPVTAVAGEYTDGETTIMIGQVATDQLPEDVTADADTTVDIGNRTVSLVETERGYAGWWTDDAVVTSVSGNVTESELRTIIEETEPAE